MSGTQGIAAFEIYLFFDNRLFADRTPFRYFKSFLVTGAFLCNNLNYLRDDLSGLLNNDVISYANILPLDFVEIVK